MCLRSHSLLLTDIAHPSSLRNNQPRSVNLCYAFQTDGKLYLVLGKSCRAFGLDSYCLGVVHRAG